MRSSAFGDNDHPNISRLANDAQHQVGTEQPAQEAPLLGPTHQYLRHFIAMSKIDDGLGRIMAFQDPALDVKISGEVQVFLDPLDVLGYRPAPAVM